MRAALALLGAAGLAALLWPRRRAEPHPLRVPVALERVAILTSDGQAWYLQPGDEVIDERGVLVPFHELGECIRRRLAHSLTIEGRWRDTERETGPFARDRVRPTRQTLLVAHVASVCELPETALTAGPASLPDVPAPLTSVRDW